MHIPTNSHLRLRWLIGSFFLPLLVVCAWVGPEKKWNNPFDPSGTNFYRPTVTKPADTIIGVNKELRLTASGIDENGTIRAFRWSFDQGKSWDTASVSADYFHAWGGQYIGENSVWVASIDNDGLVSNPDSFIVTIKSFKPYLAAVNDSVVGQNVSVNITFEATDENGTIAHYFWGSNANNWDDSSATGRASFSYPDGGPVTVRWAAVDNDGEIAFDTFNLLFNRGPKSVKLIEPKKNSSAPFSTYSYGEGTGTLRCTFSAEDPDSSADTISFFFSIGEKGTPTSLIYHGTSPSTLVKQLQPETAYTWVLTARDLFGDSSSVKGTITTASAPAAPTGMKLIKSKSAAFHMGQSGFDSSDAPVHVIAFSYHYWIDSTEVANSDFASLLGLTIPDQTTANLPATNMSWYDAVLYCNQRSKKENRDTVYSYTSITGTPGNKSTLTNVSANMVAQGYRLPTEAEWEFAYRGTSKTLFFWGNDNLGSQVYAWTDENSGNHIHAVASTKPNAAGLYDLSGNVWEWCNDWFDPAYYRASPSVDPLGPLSGSERVIRGGSWQNSVYFTQSGTRSKVFPDISSVVIGFRAVLPEYDSGN